MTKKGRLLAVVFLSIIVEFAILFLSHRSGILPFVCIEAGAILGLVVMPYKQFSRSA